MQSATCHSRFELRLGCIVRHYIFIPRQQMIGVTLIQLFACLSQTCQLLCMCSVSETSILFFFVLVKSRSFRFIKGHCKIGRSNWTPPKAKTRVANHREKVAN